MMLAASSASGSWQYLLANTRHASASCTYTKNGCRSPSSKQSFATRLWVILEVTRIATAIRCSENLPRVYFTNLLLLVYNFVSVGIIFKTID